MPRLGKYRGARLIGRTNSTLQWRHPQLTYAFESRPAAPLRSQRFTFCIHQHQPGIARARTGLETRKARLAGCNHARVRSYRRTPMARSAAQLTGECAYSFWPHAKKPDVMPGLTVQPQRARSTGWGNILSFSHSLQWLFAKPRNFRSSPPHQAAPVTLLVLR